MRAPISVGYLTPHEGVIRAGAWSMLDPAGVPVGLPPALPDWDYNTDLRIMRQLDIDLTGLLAACLLQPDTPVRAHILWHSTGSGLRGASTAVRVEDGTNILNLELSGGLLGGMLKLEARVVLGGTIEPPTSPMAPHRPGSILWSERTHVMLEGGGARFPVMPVSFARAGIASGRNGSWCLMVDSTDLSDSASGTMRVYLNTDNDHVAGYLRDPDQSSAQQFARNLRLAVIRQLVSLAVSHEELDTDADYDAGSVGELLSRVVRHLFPDRDLTVLRSDLLARPGEFEAELQGRTGYQP